MAAQSKKKYLWHFVDTTTVAKRPIAVWGKNVGKRDKDLIRETNYVGSLGTLSQHVERKD